MKKGQCGQAHSLFLEGLEETPVHIVAGVPSLRGSVNITLFGGHWGVGGEDLLEPSHNRCGKHKRRAEGGKLVVVVVE